MDKDTGSVSFLTYLVTAVILMIAGWGGLLAVLQLTSPSGGTRWLFFFTLVLAVTGTFLPLTAYLNRHFPSHPAPGWIVVMRQALWFGVYAALLAWLQLGRVLSPMLAMLVAVGLLLIELLLRLRERSQWKPQEP